MISLKLFSRIRGYPPWVILLVLNLLVSLFFIFYILYRGNQPVYDIGDELEYRRLAINLIQGNGYSLSYAYPFKPTMQREPLYPFLLAISYLLFGYNDMPIYLFQIVLHALTAIIIFYLTLSISDNRGIAWCAAVFTSLSPSLVDISLFIMTETVFTFLLALDLLIAAKALKNNSFKLFIALGLLLGITTLCRAVGIFLVPIIILLLFIQNKQRAVRYALIMLLIFTFTISPWLIRNKIISGRFQFNTKGSEVLWDMTSGLDSSNKELFATMVASFSDSLGRRLYKTQLENVLGRNNMANNLYRSQQRIDEISTDKLYFSKAIEKISKKPLKYFILSLINLVRYNPNFSVMYVFKRRDLSLMSTVSALSYDFPIIDKIIMMIFKASFFLILILMLKGMFFVRKELKNWILPISVIIYFNFLHALVSSAPRHNFPVQPYYFMFAAVAMQRVYMKYRDSARIKI